MTRSLVNPASSVKKGVRYRTWVYKTHYEKPLENHYPCTKAVGLYFLDVIE